MSWQKDFLKMDDPAKAKDLANALKTAINSVYGLTSAKFPNKLRDPRNMDILLSTKPHTIGRNRDR